MMMNWPALLSPFNGGPGDSPGRREAVLRSLESIKAKKLLRESGKKNGSTGRERSRVDP